MKILRLNFKNINSLQGKNRLDFTQSPLLDAGVFAITGPNGSGKSSVLDAITLALYGETFKFDRPAEHVMSLHSSECFAQIEFRVDEQDYRSQWQVSRAEGHAHGQLLPAQMSLMRLGEQELELANDPLKVRMRVADILGLDFRSFTRSTLLAQGDFAAFLNALDSERLDILERIVGTDIYADYKQQTQQNAEQARHQLISLQADLAAIPMMNPLTQEAREHDLADFLEQIDTLKLNAEALEAQVANQALLAELDTEYQQNVFKQQVLAQKTQQLSKDLQRIADFHGLKAFQKDISQLEQQQADFTEQQAVLQHYREELNLLQTELASLGTAPLGLITEFKDPAEQLNLISDLAFQTEQLNNDRSSLQGLAQTLEHQLNEKQNELVTVKAWLNDHQHETSLLDAFPEIGQLKKLSLQVLEHKRQHKTFLKDFKATDNQLKSKQAEEQRLSKQVPALEEEVANYEAKIAALLKGHTQDEMLVLRADQQEKVNDFKELIALAKIQNRFKDSFWVRIGLLKTPALMDSNDLNQQVLDLQERLLTEDNIKKALEQAVFNESLILKYQMDRLHLVHNEPCFLCGSVKHPYREQAPALVDSKQALADQNKRIQTINSTITKLQQQLKNVLKTQESSRIKADRLLRVQSEWLTLCNRLNIVSAEISIDHIGPIKKMLSSARQDLNDIDRIIKEIEQYQKKILKLGSQIGIQTEALNNVQALLQTDNMPENTALRNSQSLEQELQQLIAEEKVLGEQVSAQLTLLGEKMPGKGKEDALFDRLNKRRQNYQTYLLRDKSLQEDIIAIEEKIKQSQAELNTTVQRLADFSSRYSQEQRIGVHLAVIEKQKLILDQERRLTQLSAELQSKQQALLELVNPYGVQNLSELESLLSLLPQQAQLLAEQDVLAKEAQELVLHLQTLAEQRKALQTQHGTLLAVTDSDFELKQLREKISITEHEIQTAQEQLSVQATRTEKFTLLQAKVTEQEVLFNAALQELQSLETDNGHAFRRKVQRKMADKLLSRTNLILEKISGRFYVRQGELEQGLRLEVEDTFQQNARRLPKTLSGGESFVVSLALALALADIASDGRAIESLFLDEGFGNLDAEALVTIVSTLETLQTQGKKVGVISHVEGVRNRIKTQIAMVKKGDGYSALSLMV